MLFAGIAARVDAVDFQLLVRSEGRNQPALAGVSVKPPTVIAAFHLLAVKVSVGKRHAAMRTGIMQSKRTPLVVPSDGQGGLKQRGLLQAVATYLAARQGAIPEAVEHQGVWRFALRQGDIWHDLWLRVTQAAYYSRQRT
jgi:hypothetical protein